MKSCIYEGRVRHRRFLPLSHRFGYSIFLVCLDLAELDDVFRGRWLWSTRSPSLAWFRREDHFGDPSSALDRSVRDAVESRTGHRPLGPIRLLTHLRYFGYIMNPVSFYYCFGEDGSAIEAIIAEVANTPWGERHLYVLDAREAADRGGKLRFRFAKEFHVSPFLSMRQEYVWVLRRPDERLSVHMETWEAGEKMLDATLSLRRAPIGGRTLAGVLCRHPWMTARVITAIYWQALRLWLKRCPFHPHPARALAAEEAKP